MWYWIVWFFDVIRSLLKCLIQINLDTSVHQNTSNLGTFFHSDSQNAVLLFSRTPYYALQYEYFHHEYYTLYTNLFAGYRRQKRHHSLYFMQQFRLCTALPCLCLLVQIKPWEETGKRKHKWTIKTIKFIFGMVHFTDFLRLGQMTHAYTPLRQECENCRKYARGRGINGTTNESGNCAMGLVMFCQWRTQLRDFRFSLLTKSKQR